MELQIVDGDLLDQDVDVIVNAWNRNIIPWWLLLPQGVSGAIKKRGGYAPFRELGKLGPIPLGGAVITGAGKLPFKSISLFTSPFFISPVTPAHSELSRVLIFEHRPYES
jgi:O-acetyl-ADP-ribose deacetylase (regulator of RNase III)